jgi:hypothetical protein
MTVVVMAIAVHHRFRFVVIAAFLSPMADELICYEKAWLN